MRWRFAACGIRRRGASDRRPKRRSIARAVADGRSLWDTLPLAVRLSGMTPAAADAMVGFRRMMEGFRGRLEKDPLVEVASDLIRAIGYQDELARIYKDPLEQQARWAAVEEVVNALAAYEKRARRPTLSGFLDDVALGDRESEQDKDEQLKRNAIALMTLHSAKGLEFPQVYLVGMEEGLLPHRRSVEMEGSAIDEERRLCYVGITRAQDRLTISLALSRMKWGKPRRERAQPLSLRDHRPGPSPPRQASPGGGRPARLRAKSEAVPEAPPRPSQTVSLPAGRAGSKSPDGLDVGEARRMRGANSCGPICPTWVNFQVECVRAIRWPTEDTR